MNNNVSKEIENGFLTAFVDASIPSSESFRPQFITNDYHRGMKVLTTLEKELQHCDSFSISVAFITMSGLVPLLQTLKELEARNIHGRILTTDYLTFSQPQALDKLAAFSNVDLRMYRCGQSQDGFHTKGYIFKNKNVFHMLIGSSNLTSKALTLNKEWNTKLVSSQEGEFAQYIQREFDYLFYSDYSQPYDECIDDYRDTYNNFQTQRNQMEFKAESHKSTELKPNSMQRDFIASLESIRAKGKDRALLISATGTGKTYASAFAMREEKQKHVLFVVHREQIAKQALRSYRRVFGNTRTFGLLSGNEKDMQADYIFSTMQTMSKDYIMDQFDPNQFDTIIIDEVHRAGASSYQKIMAYFKPQFWLGMTASPDRTDGYDIYGLFDHNIAGEIRLQQALEEDLLCPFHYFGITDFEVDGQVLDDMSQFNLLVSDQRVDYILKQAQFYGYSGKRVKGLIFCSRKEECKALSRLFNEKGLKTTVLSGDDSQSYREECIDKLVSDDDNDYFDYIFTVDIFNEGVDIPEINQVILLRPTQSPIVFIQQLGRGLRKAENKEYVVILDFIGNYKNNFMIPIALSGDRSYNKDTVRRYVQEGSKMIPGASSIHFDLITRKRIFQSIDAANFNESRLLKESYQQLKFKVGHIPTLMDFETYGSIDPLRIFDNGTYGSYYMFLKKCDKDFKIRLKPVEEKMLEFISTKLAAGKRKDELVILQQLLNNKNISIHGDQNYQTNVFNMLTGQFATGTGANRYKDCVFIQKKTEQFEISDIFKQLLQNEDFKQLFQETIEYGLFRYQKEYRSPFENTPFTLYAKYTYEDVCRLLNWEKSLVPLNIGGYKYDSKTKTFPIFVNYDKSDDIADTIKYEDRFVSDRELIWISKSGRNLHSDDVQKALHADSLGIVIHLFVRKNKEDKGSKEFYYMGTLHAMDQGKEIMVGSKSAVEITYRLDQPVREDIYDYIVGE